MQCARLVSRRPFLVALAAALWVGGAAARGQDPENCLSCHRFRGLSRLDPASNELRLFFCDAEYYVHRQGAHARLRCTACHERSEVQVIPHAVKTPVDCSRTCHISPATGTELRFSHQRVADSLLHSAHAAESLAALEFAEPLLRPGQSACLYCHDEPLFGMEFGVPEGFLDRRGGTRCDTCHGEELPLEVNYFANHVAARMKPARPVRQLAQVCAVCHSDPQLNEQMGSHDAVASYLHSFHGKASLLGSTQTATCVDCHSSQSGDQHLILGQEHLDSSIHPDRLADTCRTAVCHPGAPPEMSTAAVHLELDPAVYPLEFYIAAFFVLMTAAVMALFFALIILELINAAVRRANPDHHRLVQLAKLLQDHPEGRELVQRMTIHQRVQHWGLVGTFAALVLTGMPIKFADTEWASWLIALLGGLTLARWIHRIAGVALIAVFLYHIAYLFMLLVRNIRRDRAAGVRVPLWKRIFYSPMVIRPSDLREFVQLIGYLLFLRKHRPHFGQFNFTQKFEYWAVFWGVPVMGLSGLALWGMPVVTEWLTGSVINLAFIIHSDEAYLAFIYIATVHLFGVIFAPVVFPLSLGTLTGQAPAVELAEAHRGELEEIARRLGVLLPHHEPERPSGWAGVRALAANVARRGYSVVLIGAYGLLAFVSLRFLVLTLVAHDAAPVEITDIPKRLDADTYFAAAAAPVQAAAVNSQARGPLAHYHHIPQWFQPDPGNTCTTSGCHAPLPHGNRIEVRAFLNMHSTFVDCGVCHVEQPTGKPGWISLPERELGDTPAILRLAGRLAGLGEVPPEQAAGVSAELAALLREALPATGFAPQLEHWLVRLNTVNPRGRVWRQLVDEMRTDIQLHVHGEYAAKIVLLQDGRIVGSPADAQRAATDEYLRRQDDLTPAAREELLARVHIGVAPRGALCTPCHAADPTLMNLAELGYPPARVEALLANPVLRSVLSIEAGTPFHLPLEEGVHE